MSNKLQINPPDGHEIDQDKSDLSKGVIHFKQCKKVLSYEDVFSKLFVDDPGYNPFLQRTGEIDASNDWDCKSEINHMVAKDSKQLESILALNKLCNVAKYLNRDWLPKNGNRIAIRLNYHLNIYFNNDSDRVSGCVYFKNQKLAQQAIDILGEDEIRKALTLNH